MNNLGLLYTKGEGIAQDYDKAREWYQKSANAGNAYAMTNLGLRYREGLGVAQDYEKPRELLEKAADAGLAQAMKQLGLAVRKRPECRSGLRRGAHMVPKGR